MFPYLILYCIDCIFNNGFRWWCSGCLSHFKQNYAHAAMWSKKLLKNNVCRFVYYLRVGRTSWCFLSVKKCQCAMVAVWQTETVTCEECERYSEWCTSVYTPLFDRWLLCIGTESSDCVCLYSIACVTESEKWRLYIWHSLLWMSPVITSVMLRSSLCTVRFFWANIARFPLNINGFMVFNSLTALNEWMILSETCF